MKKAKLAAADSIAQNNIVEESCPKCSILQKEMGDRIEDLLSSIDAKQSMIMDLQEKLGGLQTENNSLKRDIAATNSSSLPGTDTLLVYVVV